MKLQEAEPRFRSRGLGIAAMTYDDAATLATFAARQSIRYPLLADPDSSIIRSFGMIDPDNSPANRPEYAKLDMAYPGYFLIGRDGVVQERSLDPAYNDRRTSGGFLVKLFPELEERGASIAAPHLGITPFQSDRIVSPGSRLTLGVRVRLAKGMHVYAPGVERYRPIALTVTQGDGFAAGPASYPEPKVLRLEAIRETVPVYEKEIRIEASVRLAAESLKAMRALGDDRAKLQPLEIRGVLEYQACDARRCYLPESTPVTWAFSVRPLDFHRLAAPGQ